MMHPSVWMLILSAVVVSGGCGRVALPTLHRVGLSTGQDKGVLIRTGWTYGMLSDSESYQYMSWARTSQIQGRAKMAWSGPCLDAAWPLPGGAYYFGGRELWVMCARTGPVGYFPSPPDVEEFPAPWYPLWLGATFRWNGIDVAHWVSSVPNTDSTGLRTILRHTAQYEYATTVTPRYARGSRVWNVASFDPDSQDTSYTWHGIYHMEPRQNTAITAALLMEVVNIASDSMGEEERRTLAAIVDQWQPWVVRLNVPVLFHAYYSLWNALPKTKTSRTSETSGLPWPSSAKGDVPAFSPIG